MKTLSFIKATANVIVSRENSFNAQRNVIYRIFFGKDEFDIETKKQVLQTVSEDSTQLRKVVDVIKSAKKSKESASVNNRLKAASFFNCTAKKVDDSYEIVITYTVKQILNAANVLLEDQEKPNKALKADVLAEMLKTNKKRLSKAQTEKSELKLSADNAEKVSKELHEIYLAKLCDVNAKIDKLNEVIKYLKEERKAL